MTTTLPNCALAWRGLLMWLEAHADGEAEMQIALSMWGFQKLVDATTSGDVSPLQGETGRPSMIRLTDQGRAKLWTF